MELVACSRYVLEEMKVHPGADLCLKLVDEAAMEVLHVQWMDLPGPPDVMSFPMDELRPGRDGQEPEEGVLGDIVLCPGVAARQAAEAGHATEEELLLLTTHGILHLLGYDHAEPDEEREMFELQRTLLLTFLAGHTPPARCRRARRDDHPTAARGPRQPAGRVPARRRRVLPEPDVPPPRGRARGGGRTRRDRPAAHRRRQRGIPLGRRVRPGGRRGGPAVLIT